MNVLYAVLIGLAFVVIEPLTGGTRLLFSLPAYGVLAVAAFASLGDLRRSKASPDNVCLASSAIFFGYILGRTLTSPVAYIAWDDQFMVIGCLMLYLLTACYFTDPRRRLWVLAVLMALAAVNLAIGARQFARNDSYMILWFVRSPQYLGRASGLYICPDHLAGYLEVLGCLSLSLALWGRLRGWVKLLLGYGALMCFVGLLLTVSRGGLISTCAGLAVLAALSLGRIQARAREWFGRAVLATVVLAGVGVFALSAIVARSQLIQSRIHHALDLQHDARPMLWAAALPQFQLEPIFGTGAATYLYYGRMFRNPLVQSDPVRPHNDYLELLAEYGLAGAAGWLLFIVAHGRWGWKAYGRLSRRVDPLGTSLGGSNAAAWNIGALAAVTCLLGHSFVDFNLHIPANALLLAFVFGILANPGRSLDTAGENVVRWRRTDLLPRLALPALGVWLAVAGLPKIPGEYFCEKARIALRDGHPAAVLGLAAKGIEHQQQNPVLYYYLGQARQSLAGDGPDSPVARSFRVAASEAYAAGLRLAPMDIYLLVHQGEMFTRLGDFERAESIFRQVEACDPRSSYALTYDGFYLQTRGLLPEAEEVYRKAATLEYNQTASRNLAEVERARAAGNQTE